MTPDFAIFYAMLADHLRLQTDNPTYALQVAEDGLALIAGDPSQADFRAILQTSRAYALADLGEFDKAHRGLRLALPFLEMQFGPDAIEDYQRHAAQWAKGELSDFNRSALDIADETLKEAYTAFDEDAFGRVLVLAGSAQLPLGTTLSEARVRGVNLEAELLTARALHELARPREAANAYLRALGFMTKTPWQLQGAPDWLSADMTVDENRMGFEILNGLASAASAFGRSDVERMALSAATPLARSGRELYTVTLRRARLTLLDGDTANALELLEKSRVEAAEAGLDLDEAVSRFYTHLVELNFAEDSQIERAAQALIANTDELSEFFTNQGVHDRAFVFENAASALLRKGNYPQVLAYTRQAFQQRQTDLARRQDTNFGRREARRAGRASLEQFLAAAHAQASVGADEALTIENCPVDTSFRSCLIVQR
jgi:hypothetical protein